MYCKDCKHWNKLQTNYGTSEHQAGGYCLSNSITEDYGVYSENSLVYSYSESGSFWTGAKFGCVNFEDK